MGAPQAGHGAPDPLIGHRQYRLGLLSVLIPHRKPARADRLHLRIFGTPLSLGFFSGDFGREVRSGAMGWGCADFRGAAFGEFFRPGKVGILRIKEQSIFIY